jgi:hypothetical protein
MFRSVQASEFNINVVFFAQVEGHPKFFSRPEAGLTNQVPVRDSRDGTPLLSVARSRAVKLHGYVVICSVNTVLICSLVSKLKFHLECLNFKTLNVHLQAGISVAGSPAQADWAGGLGANLGPVIAAQAAGRLMSRFFTSILGSRAARHYRMGRRPYLYSRNRTVGLRVNLCLVQLRFAKLPYKPVK